jgi:hypothetical protein
MLYMKRLDLCNTAGRVCQDVQLPDTAWLEQHHRPRSVARGVEPE